MRPPQRFLARTRRAVYPPASLAAALLAACGDRPPPTADEACPIAERVQLAAAPDGFAAAPDTYYDFYAAGDHLLYTFDPPDDRQRTYWHKHRCGGEPTEFPSLLPGLDDLFHIDTPAGSILYARSAFDVFVVDRLDDPGADIPRPVQGLSFVNDSLVFTSGTRWAQISQATLGDSDVRRAAGLGGAAYVRYTHTGDPDVPAALVGFEVVQSSTYDDHLLVLDEDGTLRTFDPFTGSSAELLTGVRYYSASSGRALIWQAIGDDVAEPVYLRDLDAGTDVQIAVNELAAASWGRTENDDSIGVWTWTSDQAAAAMFGTDRTLVAAVRTDTGAPLAIPAHLCHENSFEREFLLILPDPAEHVEALWNPLTGDVREVYRGSQDPEVVQLDGDVVEYTLPDGDDLQSRWRVDLATGETTKLLSQVAGNVGKLDERRYLLFDTITLVTHPLGDLAVGVPVRDITFVDLATGARQRLADDVTGYALYPDEGLVYLDVHGPDPGVWAVPFPK